MQPSDSRHQRQAVVSYALIGILVSGLLITGIGIVPLYRQLREYRTDTLIHQLTVRTLIANEVVSKMKSVAFQITSRSALRTALTDYNQGRMTLDSLRAFSYAKIEDALLISDSVQGIVRLARDGQTVASVGREIPQRAWKVPSETATAVTLAVEAGDPDYIIAAAPIIDNEETRRGTDIVAYSVAELSGLIYDYSGLGTTGYTLILYRDGSDCRLLLRPEGERTRGMQPSTDALAGIFATACEDRQRGLAYDQVGERTLAVFGPIADVDWALAIIMDSSELFQPINRRLITIAGAVLVVMALSMVALRRVIGRPVADLSTTADFFQREVAKKTDALQRELDERKRMVKELKHARDQAQKADRAKSEFLANMSHEIRTPLNGIVGLIDILHTSTQDTQQLELLDAMKQSSDVLGTIINDILDFHRIEAGRLVIHQELVEFRPLLESACSSFRHQAKEKGLSFRLDLDPTLPKMMATDRIRFSQVVSNLLSNAVKFTHEGSITVHARTDSATDPAAVEVCVQDTGIGIAQADQKKLFTSFLQLDGSTTKHYQGSGLGLVISRRLTELLGGSLWFTSTEGAGSWFCFRLPAVQHLYDTDRSPPQGHAETTKPTDSDEESGAARSLSILAAEDNRINQIVLEHVVEDAGHTVTFAASGEEAVRLYSQRRFDLVLMDVQMPGMDGLQACSEIRAMEQLHGRRTPIIALTAYAMPEDRQRMLDAGMDEYLAKPIDGKELLALIARMDREGSSRS